MNLITKSSPILMIAALTTVFVALPSASMASSHRGRASRPALAKKKTPKKVSPKAAECSPAIKPVVGTWYVNDNGREDHDKRLVLRPNGTFAFIGTGWKSEGNFAFKDNAIALKWTKVDGSPVKPGQMHKEIPMEPGGTFHIDTYQYAKHADGSQAKNVSKQPAAEAIVKGKNAS